MTKRISPLPAICCGLGMLLLILDAKTAMYGASTGIELCIKTVIPSLLPFFLLSNLLTSTLMGHPMGVLRPLGRWLRLPHGAEHIFLAGLLGGYPVGAAMLSDAARCGHIHNQDASRMIRYCSNAGPALIFGMGACVFDRMWLCWAIWLITVASAVLVALITPGSPHEYTSTASTASLSVSAALKKSLQTMALVCGWVILFRVVLAFFDRWFLWLLEEPWQTAIYGIMEISNGCCNLAGLSDQATTFTLFSGFLSFGGLCVYLQTISLLDGTGIRPVHYLCGKCTQAAFAILLCQVVQWKLNLPITVLAVTICVIYFIMVRKNKKPVAIPQIIMYNKKKPA